jgi:hypothetical protein
MKKLIIVMVFLAMISPVFAQQQQSMRGKHYTSDRPIPGNVYVYNVPIVKIFPSSEGYIVQYRRTVFDVGTIGIPNEWFIDAGGRAELMKLPPGTNWPSISVFYIDGEFSHIRLYVHRSKAHTTWGSVPMGADVSRYFENSDAFALEF